MLNLSSICRRSTATIPVCYRAEWWGYAYFYVIGYEELAVPYIKKWMEAGATRKGLRRSGQISEPESFATSDYGMPSIHPVYLKVRWIREIYGARYQFLSEEPFYQAKEGYRAGTRQEIWSLTEFLKPILKQVSEQTKRLSAHSHKAANTAPCNWRKRKIRNKPLLCSIRPCFLWQPEQIFKIHQRSSIRSEQTSWLSLLLSEVLWTFNHGISLFSTALIGP